MAPEETRDLTITGVEIIDISITQRTTCDSITANADAVKAQELESVHRSVVGASYTILRLT